ncbi:MAG: hypothetical protein E7536_08660 [Ruminococcaceae bacterium]|nr:hypothetical protein [Oscillospiraceae bacterium]
MTGKRLITSLIQLLPLILVVTVIFGAVGGYINYFVLEHEYTATTTFYVMEPVQENDGDNNSIITYYEKLALDYSEIAMSRRVTMTTAKNLGLDGLSEYEIKVAPVDETRVMELTVTGHDIEMVKEIADEMVDVFTDVVKETIRAENVNVIDYAYVTRTGPMRMQNTILIALAGAVLVVGLIVLKEFTDTTLRTAEEVETVFDLPVLAQVNRIKSTQSSKSKNLNKKGV